jgi:hypothetical protein
VTVDGRAVGDAPVEVQLPAGTHLLTMHREGYVDASTSAVISVGERREVSMRLEPKPSIFGRWWFWTGDGFEPQQVRGPLMRW